jgi:hypothetical protein
MNTELVTELSKFISTLNFTCTHTGGAYPDIALSYSLDRLMDLGIYEVKGYAKVEQKCNNLTLSEFESNLKKITRNIEDEVANNIHSLPKISTDIIRIKDDLFSYDGKFNGKIQTITTSKTIGKAKGNIIEDYPTQNNIITFYQYEIYKEIGSLDEKYQKFEFKNIKIDYHINATEEQYINCLQYLLDSLISSLENKKYMYTSIPQTQIVTNTEKIQWIESDLLLGYLINRLENSEMIILPKIDTDKLDLKKSAKLLFNAFKFKDRKNISPSEEAIEKAISARYTNRLNQKNVDKVDKLVNELRLLIIDLQ